MYTLSFQRLVLPTIHLATPYTRSPSPRTSQTFDSQTKTGSFSLPPPWSPPIVEQSVYPAFILEKEYNDNDTPHNIWARSPDRLGAVLFLLSTVAKIQLLFILVFGVSNSNLLRLSFRVRNK